jgi:phage terminase large subunit-like protein
MKISLHEHQIEIFNNPARFKVVAAGRRFGKSYLAAITLFVEAAKTHKTRQDGEVIDLGLEEVYYVAPTFEQGKKILWPLLKEIGSDLIASKYENTGTLTLINGRRISIKGADRPDSLRGVGLSYVVLDEFAFMKEEVWELILRPTLARAEGGALFIGTPDGKNHFFDMWLQANEKAGWHAWSFKSTDNPFIPIEELKIAKSEMSEERYRQEMEASFEAGGGNVMTRDMFEYAQDPSGDTYVTADLAGYVTSEGGRKRILRDEHAIAIVRVHQGGWHIKKIIHGHWDVRETALRLVKAARDYRPLKFGIERGMAMNAVLPYLNDEMNRLGCFFAVESLTHGNNRKVDRIKWALQGRAEKGRITLEDDDDDWQRVFLEQAVDFPSVLAHDDLIDAVSYVDQIADPYYDGPDNLDEWVPLDDIAGY